MAHDITENCADMWPDRRLLELFNIELPIVQAPVAGAMDWELAAAAADGRARIAPMRNAQSRPDTRADDEDPRPHEETRQSQFLLPYAAGAQQRPRGALARTPGAVLPRARDRSRRAGAFEQPHRVQFRYVRHRRGDEARRRELPLWTAGGGAPAAAQGGRFPGHELGHHRRRGALAR